MKVLLLIGILLGISACGSDAPNSNHLAKAKEYIAAADDRSAEIELKNALRIDGAQPEARLLLGKIYLDRDDNPAAEKELLRAQELGWAAQDVNPALGKALLAQGKTREVLALKADDLDGPAAAQLLATQAIAALLDGKSDEAKTLVSAARARDPQSQVAILAEARMFALQGDTTRAMEAIAAVLETTPDNAEAWRLQGHILWRQQKLKEARTAIGKSLEFSKITFADYLSRALINIQLRDYAAATKDTYQLSLQLPKHPGTNYAKGLLRFNNQQYRKAISSLTRARYAAPKYPLVLYYLSLAYVIDGNAGMGLKYARQYVELAPDDPEGRKLLAALLLQDGKIAQARDILLPVLDFNPDDPGALRLRANARLLDKQVDLALLDYARSSALEPKVPIEQLPVTVDLLSGGLGLGAKAGPALKQRLDFLPASPRKEVLQILGHLQRKEYEQAIAIADSYRWTVPEATAPYDLLGTIYLAAGQGDKAREAFDSALLRDPNDPSANLNLAQMARDEGDSVRERKHYQAVLEKHADNLLAQMNLALLDAREKDTPGMVGQLKMAIDQNPHALEPRLGLARYYLDTGSANLVAPLFTPLTNLQQLSPRVLELYVQAQLAQHEYTSAYRATQQLVAMLPQVAQYRYLAWQAASGAGAQPEAQAALAELLRLDANNVPALVAQAESALAAGQPEQFDQLLAKAAALAPEDPGVLRLKSGSARRAGKVQEALTDAERAFALQASTVNFLALTEARRAAGREQAARTAMRQWIEEHPEDIAVRLAWSDILLAEGDASGARAQYNAVLALHPDNVLALNNLAWSLRTDNPAQALEYSRKAAGLAPAEPAALDTLAVIAHLNGDQQLAGESIRRALALAPGNPSLRYHEAMIVAAQGDQAAAIATLRELVGEKGVEFPERAEAQALLHKLEG